MRHFFCDSLKRILMACALTVVGIFSATAETLPTGYTELEYIESTGTQYIDTGYSYANEVTRTYVEFSFTANTVSQKNLFGCSVDDKKYISAYVASGGGSLNFYIGSGSKKSMPTSTSDTAKHTVDIYTPAAVGDTGHIILDGSDTTYAKNASNISGANMGVFTQIDTTKGATFVNSRRGAFKIYRFTMWDNGTLVRDFVPAKNASGVVGMYDTVNDVFYTNRGTGTFTAGPTACPGGTLETHHESGLPVGYTKVEYLEGDGNTYIDMGITPIANVLRTKGKYQVTANAPGGTPFGAVANPAPRIGFRMFSNADSGHAIIQTGSASVDIVLSQYSNVVDFDVTVNDVIDTITGQVNSTTVNTTNTGINLNFDQNMLLFKGRLGSNTILGGQFRIWSFSVEKEGVPVRDFVPAKRESDNVLGMYDLVSGTFFTNAGTGTFSAGNTVSDPIVEQCVAGTQIKIATTKYTEDAFAGLMTTLSEAITKVTNIVDTTVQQATEIGNLATTKQDRPDTDCPAGRKCLLIMGADNKPHWYLIQE